MKIFFGERIKMLRKKAGLNQAELAVKIGVSKSAIGMYEQNRRSPDNETMLKLCSFFDVTADYMLGKTELPKGVGFLANNDVSEMLDEFTKKLSEQEDLMFDGTPLTEDDRAKILEAIRKVAEIAENAESEA